MGHHDHGHAVAPGAVELVHGRRLQPSERPHLALVADGPVQIVAAEACCDAPRGLLHLPLVGIAARDHALGQAVGGEEQPRRPGLCCRC